MRRAVNAVLHVRDAIGIWLYSLQHSTALIMMLSALSLAANPTVLITALGEQARLPLADMFVVAFAWAAGALSFKRVSLVVYYRLIFLILFYAVLLGISAVFVVHASANVPILSFAIWLAFTAVARAAERQGYDPGNVE